LEKAGIEFIMKYWRKPGLISGLEPWVRMAC